jgi:Ca-activated chloride channel family protein
LLQKLEELKPLMDEKDRGTAIGYAVFKTVNLIVGTRNYAQDLKGKGKPAYEIKNAIIVLITDGFQNINPGDTDKRLRTIDVREAAKYAKENGIRLYVINVDANMAKEEFTPHRKIMQNVTELTGGQFFIVGTNQSLEDIYHDIDRLEKDLLPNEAILQPPEAYTRISYYPYFLGLGLIALALSLILSTTLLRRFP